MPPADTHQGENPVTSPPPPSRVTTAAGEPPARLTRRKLSAAASGSLALFLVLLGLVAAGWRPLLDGDAAVARATHRAALAHPGVTEANRVLTDWVWDPWTLRALAALVAVWLLYSRAWRLALWLVLTAAVGTVLQQVVKSAVGRPRPVWRHPVDSAHYAAFPSGHVMTATVTCGVLLWILWLRHRGSGWWWTACAVSAVSCVGVGFTRIWLGVHWLSDVVGGLLLGLATVAVAVLVCPGTRNGGPRERS